MNCKYDDLINLSLLGDLPANWWCDPLPANWWCDPGDVSTSVTLVEEEVERFLGLKPPCQAGPEGPGSLKGCLLFGANSAMDVDF